ncbi:tRNA delta(2)-isopentenylpyrophosphate transferase [Arcticibacter svalbardensis MN12-7]|uniref:tRNA dimethylallyltransferase n=1 Tax=Arcticibacter svalbardensis MN12-7 TaxID=1150600 RepID=R9GM96_9SPHI|nr:tRNA (adenosine(37)-N6)-dimethylallyltransferase MiaA [Arcticibacter svalbardensis]EOR92962.1 tRNA delta(2)-isopentenylpyrophosphate transferase [Arcticibacter svalbardensis MN12-7]
MGSHNALIVIAGPTAIGKTELAIKVALNYDTEIISADSRQFYKEMSIGTAKPNQTELGTVKHHFIDSISIEESYSAGRFENETLHQLNEIYKKKNTAVLVGGSGLFIKAVCEGFDEFPDVDPLVRDFLNKEYADKGIQTLQDQLLELDPSYAKEVDLNNPQRLIRALEVCMSTGQPFSLYRSNSIKLNRPFSSIKIGLNMDRPLLYERINKRVDMMIQAGLVDEVDKLKPFRHLNALNTVGYAEIFDYLDGSSSLEQAIDKIKQNTRRFAKRQLTWFRKDPDITWFHPEDYRGIISHISQQK